MARLPILCYHKIGPISEEGRRLNVEPARLASHIKYFQRRGSEFVQARSLAHHWPQNAVCLTFDDAYISTLTYGVEVMSQLGVTASIYAVGSKLGLASDWDGAMARPLAPCELLVAAANKGFEIGNHTQTHRALAGRTWAEQLAEMQEAHNALASCCVTATSIAYPYGSFDFNTGIAFSHTGYSVGLGLSRRPAASGDLRAALPRIVIAYGDTAAHLIYKVLLRWRLPIGKIRASYIR